MSEEPGVELAALDDDALLAHAEAVEDRSRRMAVEQQAVAAEVVARGLPGKFGISAVKLLVMLLRIPPGEARARLERATELPDQLPMTAEAQAEGALSTGHVQVIRHTMKALPEAVTPDERAEAEAVLVERARRVDPSALATIGLRLRAGLDPEGTRITERELVARRELTFTRDVDGSYRLRGRLDPEGAETVRVALDALAAPAPADNGTPDPRTPARRQADALVELAHRAITSGKLPDTGGRPTQVLLLTDLADLQAKAGLAELSHTRSPVTIETALRIACDAEVIPAVFDQGQILSAGRARRLATRRQRDALIARDRGCAASGCDAPPAWTQAHHIVHWAHGGRTDLDNLVLLCGQHHRAVHTGRWTITTDAHGIPQVRPPPWLKAA